MEQGRIIDARMNLYWWQISLCTIRQHFVSIPLEGVQQWLWFVSFFGHLYCSFITSLAPGTTGVNRMDLYHRHFPCPVPSCAPTGDLPNRNRSGAIDQQSTFGLLICCLFQSNHCIRGWKIQSFRHSSGIVYCHIRHQSRARASRNHCSLKRQSKKINGLSKRTSDSMSLNLMNSVKMTNRRLWNKAEQLVKGWIDRICYLSALIFKIDQKLSRSPY